MDADLRSNMAKYECLLFDMDDTLYPMSTGINSACRKNIQEYMQNHLHIDEKEVPKMCFDLYKEHGTTMAGLKALGFEFDNDEFHEYIHGRLPYEILKPDPVLRNLLLSMPQRKIIFTNADKAHAARVLNRLGIEDCFEGLICFETLNPPISSSETSESDNEDGDFSKENCSTKQQILCKPSIKAMEVACQIANINPEKHTRNIASGKAIGLHTVIVGSPVMVPGADLALSSMHNIREALPEIWEDEEGEPLETVLPATSVETVVLA